MGCKKGERGAGVDDRYNTKKKRVLSRYNINQGEKKNRNQGILIDPSRSLSQHVNLDGKAMTAYMYEWWKSLHHTVFRTIKNINPITMSRTQGLYQYCHLPPPSASHPPPLIEDPLIQFPYKGRRRIRVTPSHSVTVAFLLKINRSHGQEIESTLK